MRFTMFLIAQQKVSYHKMSNKLTKRGYIVLKNTPLYYIPAFYIILYTGTHFFVAKIVSKTCD